LSAAIQAARHFSQHGTGTENNVKDQ